MNYITISKQRINHRGLNSVMRHFKRNFLVIIIIMLFDINQNKSTK